MICSSASADLSSTRVNGATYGLDSPQFEVGAFATSLIPTYGAAAARVADSAKMTGTNFSSWFNSAAQLAGTIYASGIPMTPASYGTSQQLINIDDATLLNRHVLLRANTTGAGVAAMIIASTTVINNTFAAWVTGTVGKLAYAYAVNDQAHTFNAAAVQTATSSTLPTVTQLTLGARADGTGVLNGWIKSVQFYPARLPNAQLQALTA
jgi:hypothetical protein